MIRRAQCQIRASHAQSRASQLVEGLRRGHFVNQMQIDEDDRRSIGFGNNNV